jgi:L-seryl-tRNA(Ser) seleniumtransferase
LAESAAQAAADAGRGYLNLELDLGTGKRSSRQDAVRDWICQLLGSESATVVNNNAAATVIALRALAANREVIVSRGELVEIGGSFRIPDIMGVSGALLREVGTTNMTRIRDYERALSANTAALLRVHCSNYRIHGHTESASIDELSALAKKHHLLLIDDIGSGALIDYVRWGLTGEPLAHASLQAGADLVLFSGDKLLGGPQAGILAGRADLIQKIEKDPLMRAFRLDKMSLAALEATLRIYLNPQRALLEIPVLRMLEQSQATLRERAERLADRLRALPQIAIVEACEDSTYVGGGSLPDKQMQTMIVRLKSRSGGETEFARRLRLGVPAVMARIQEGWLILDLRTIFPNQEESLLEAVAACS